MFLLPPIEAPGRMDHQWILLPFIPPFRGLVPTSRPVEENSSQCAYQLLIDLQIQDKSKWTPPSYCIFLILAHCRWALTRPVLIAIYWCSRHRKSHRLHEYRPPLSVFPLSNGKQRAPCGGPALVSAATVTKAAFWLPPFHEYSCHSIKGLKTASSDVTQSFSTWTLDDRLQVTWYTVVGAKRLVLFLFAANSRES